MSVADGAQQCMQCGLTTCQPSSGFIVGFKDEGGEDARPRYCLLHRYLRRRFRLRSTTSEVSLPTGGAPPSTRAYR
jgi:hypothetical protein